MKPHSAAAAAAIAMMIFILFSEFDGTSAAITKFTNLQCETYDPNITTFPECKLNVIGRGNVSLSVYAKMWQLPVTKFVVNMALYQKANGFKPFLYNTTVDYCQFVKRSARNIFLKIVMNFIKDFTNINHSCPINHDFIIKNMILSEDKFRLIPLPSGEYMAHFRYDTTNKYHSSVKVYFKRTE